MLEKKLNIMFQDFSQPCSRQRCAQIGERRGMQSVHPFLWKWPLSRMHWIVLDCASGILLKRKSSSRITFKANGSSPRSPTNPSVTARREGGVTTALPEHRGDLKAPLHYGRNLLILGGILAVLPLGLSVFFHFVAICTRLSKTCGDCTGTKTMAGLDFFFLLC